jgi:hypothetical protein
MRYEEITPDVLKIAADLVSNVFPELTNANIRYVFDTKKKMHKGRLVFASIHIPNELTDFLANEELDYVIRVDKNIWNAIEEPDRIRIIRHELRHTYVDNEAKVPFKLVDHDFQDFYEESRLNADDPAWSQRVGAVGESVYEKMKEDAKEE